MSRGIVFPNPGPRCNVAKANRPSGKSPSRLAETLHKRQKTGMAWHAFCIPLPLFCRPQGSSSDSRLEGPLGFFRPGSRAVSSFAWGLGALIRPPRVSQQAQAGNSRFMLLAVEVLVDPGGLCVVWVESVDSSSAGKCRGQLHCIVCTLPGSASQSLDAMPLP